MRHWEGRSGFSVSLLPRALSWVIPGAGAGLRLTPGSRVAVSAPVRPPRWRDVASTPGRRGLVSAGCDLARPVISRASGNRVCPIILPDVQMTLSTGG